MSTYSHIETDKTLMKATKHWKYVAPVLSFPRNEREYNKLVICLDKLLDIIQDNEKHPLIGLVDVLSNLVSFYEETHYKKPKIKGIEALKFLMESHFLNQTDFPEIGSQGVISEILSGKRSLNLRQIKLLAKRFNVDPSTFIDM